MNDHSRREFLQALGLAPFAIAASTADAAKPAVAASATPVASPAAPPEDPLKGLKEFVVPDSVEPVTIFAASRGPS